MNGDAPALPRKRRPSPLPITVGEIIDRYLVHVQSFDAKAGRPTREQAAIRAAVRPLARLYGYRPAGGVRRRHLKAVRQAMVDAGLSRGVVVRMARWAAEEELVPVRVWRRLQVVRPLERGKTSAPDWSPVLLVDDITLERALP